MIKKTLIKKVIHSREYPGRGRDDPHCPLEVEGTEKGNTNASFSMHQRKTAKEEQTLSGTQRLSASSNRTFRNWFPG